MHIITIDFETYWDSKNYTLSKMGPIEYIRDPRFAVQMVGIRIDKNPVQVFTSGEDNIGGILRSLELHKPDRMVVAHNLNGFDALILSEVYNIKPYWMLDTMAAMRWVGLSRIRNESHAVLTKLLGNGTKIAGTVISDGKQWPDDFTPYEREKFKTYCADDVLQCSENIHDMLAYLTPDAIRFSTITARMATQPIFNLDADMLRTYIQELDDAAEKAREEVSELFHFATRQDFMTAIRSSDTVCNMLRQLGVEPPMKISVAKTATKRAQIEKWLKDAETSGMETSNPIYQHWFKVLQDPEEYAVYTPALSKDDLDFTDLLYHPDERVRLLVQTRLTHNSSIDRSRAERFLTLAETERPLPVMLNVFKAHTSRYTAGNSEGQTDGTNLQNLKKHDTTQLTLRKSISVPKGMELISVDSSQIEARMLAWLAGQSDLLNTFATGGDPYSMQAALAFCVAWEDIKDGAKAGDPTMKMYRNVGKTCVLSAGYQVGARKFSNTLLRKGVRLHEDLEQHHALAYHAHAIYRSTNTAIVQFWKLCQQVIEHMYVGGSGTFGGPNQDVFKYGPMFIGNTSIQVPSVEMPTGFIMRYPRLRIEADETGNNSYFYDRPRGRNMIRTKIYGGSFCENLTQGLAFQLLMWQGCRMDESDVPLQCNVHDAWIAVCDKSQTVDNLSLMKYWMTQVPSWLEGLPVACTGDVGTDYTIA